MQNESRCRIEAGKLRNSWLGGMLDASGAALVELAFTMPILVLILIGATEFGRLAYFAIEVSSAAYSGASYAAQNHGTVANTVNTAAAAARDAANVPGLTTTTSTACYCSDGTAITCSNAAINCVSPAHISEYVQVKTSASVSPMFDYPGISNTWMLHGSETMRVQQ